MKLEDALDYVQTYGIAMLTAEDANLQAIAVTAADDGPITEAEDFAVTAYVIQKLSSVEMKKAKIPAFDKVFAQAIGKQRVPTSVHLKVVETGSKFVPQNLLSVPATQQGAYGGPPPVLDAQKYFHSLRCGIGITNPVGGFPTDLSVGTLGFFVSDDGVPPMTYLVSNNHVIGQSSDAARATKVLGESVVQPGTLDLTAVELLAMPNLIDLEKLLKIAEVAAIVPLQFIPPPPSGHIPVNRVDAAIAGLITPNRPLNDINRLTFGGGIRGTSAFLTDPNDPNKILGDARVYKVGRTSGYTEGTVVGLGGTAVIPYGAGQKAYFAGQLVVRASRDNVGPFSDPGDSGSGVLNSRHELVGLLFAGSRLQTLVNPINEVLNELEKSLTGVAKVPRKLTVVQV